MFITHYQGTLKFYSMFVLFQQYFPAFIISYLVLSHSINVHSMLKCYLYLTPQLTCLLGPCWIFLLDSKIKKIIYIIYILMMIHYYMDPMLISLASLAGVDSIPSSLQTGPVENTLMLTQYTVYTAIVIQQVLIDKVCGHQSIFLTTHYYLTIVPYTIVLQE